MIWKRVGRKMRGEVQVDLLPWQMHEAYLPRARGPRRGNHDQLQWANSPVKDHPSFPKPAFLPSPFTACGRLSHKHWHAQTAGGLTSGLTHPNDVTVATPKHDYFAGLGWRRCGQTEASPAVRALSVLGLHTAVW